MHLGSTSIQHWVINFPHICQMGNMHFIHNKQGYLVLGAEILHHATKDIIRSIQQGHIIHVRKCGDGGGGGGGGGGGRRQEPGRMYPILRAASGT
eukprot:763702-Hanusia_phi.AAC.2